MTFDQQLKKIRATGKKAHEELRFKYQKLNEWFAGDYDALYLLSFCLRYFVMDVDGRDEELETGGISFPPHYLEMLQATALSHSRTDSLKPLWYDAEKLKTDVMEIGHLIKLKFQKLPDDVVDEKGFNQYQVRTHMMGYHHAVRNWAYHFQMLKVAQDLARLIRQDFMTMYHIDPENFMTLLFTMSSAIETRVNDYLRKIMSALANDDYLEIQNKYQKAIDQDSISEQGKERLWEKSGKNLEDLRALLLAHSDLFLVECFTWTIEDIIGLAKNEMNANALTNLMNKLSLSFLDLKDYPQEHIVLNNPVHTKPFIKVDENSFFSALWMTVPHISLNMLEYLVGQNDKLRKKYEIKKAQYLEDQAELLFKSSFPTAKVYRGSKYTGIDLKDYENDLLVIIDSFALIVECKSGTVSDAAKRGAPNRLFKTLKELVEDPSRQAVRFINYLKANKGKHIFRTNSNSDSNHKNVIDTSGVHHYIPLGVTFSHLGLTGTNLKLLIDGGITEKNINELAPSISLTDLQIIFATLETEASKIHYLHRRREFETHIKYFADELDLLGFYLDNGFNIGDKENKTEWVFNLILESKVLDPYFTASNENSSIQKPYLKMTPWWSDILEQLSKKQPSKWMDFSYILLNMNESDQHELESNYKKVAESVLDGTAELEHNWVVFRTPNRDRQYSFAVYPYLNRHRAMRDDVIQDILDLEYKQNSVIKGSLVLGVNIEERHYPYSILSGYLSGELFDNLFSDVSTNS